MNAAIPVQIGEPEGDVMPVGRYAVTSLVGVHRDVIKRVRTAQPVLHAGRERTRVHFLAE